MVSCKELVRQLGSGSPADQHQAVAALSALSLTRRNWLSAVGAISRLVELLHSASTTEPRAPAIQHLLWHIAASCPCEEARGLTAAPDGIISPLVPLLRHDNMGVCLAAARTLSTLALSDINRQKVIEAGAIIPLVQLLKSDSEDKRMAAVRALMDLSCENKAGRTQVAAAGAIAPLVRLLQAARSEQFDSHAIMLLANLASNDAKPVVEAGAIPLIVKRLTGSPCRHKIWQPVPWESYLMIPEITLQYWRRLRSSPWCTSSFTRARRRHMSTLGRRCCCSPRLPPSPSSLSPPAPPPPWYIWCALTRLRCGSLLGRSSISSPPWGSQASLRALVLLLLLAQFPFWTTVSRWLPARRQCGMMLGSCCSKPSHQPSRSILLLARPQLQPLPRHLQPLPLSSSSSSRRLPGRGRAAGRAVRRACR